jgi:starvation-inducible DNA-binding protein
MFTSPSPLAESARTQLVETLNERLADGLDLHSQIKVAHWNIKGAQFAALHPLFESFATSLAQRTDELAERAVTLGGRAYGTSRYVAKRSHLKEYPQDAKLDLEHVAAMATNIEAFLVGMRTSRSRAYELKDHDTVDLLTNVITEFEKYAWFLRATLER